MTAIEWLERTMYDYTDKWKNEFQMEWDFLDQLIKEAKELEKQQIIKAWELEGDEYVRNGKDYYNITFKLRNNED
jgi:hypothetical protein